MLIQSNQRPLHLRRQIPKHRLIRRMNPQGRRNKMQPRRRIRQLDARKIPVPMQSVPAACLGKVALQLPHSWPVIKPAAGDAGLHQPSVQSPATARSDRQSTDQASPGHRQQKLALASKRIWHKSPAQSPATPGEAQIRATAPAAGLPGASAFGASALASVVLGSCFLAFFLEVFFGFSAVSETLVASAFGAESALVAVAGLAASGATLPGGWWAAACLGRARRAKRW